MAGLNFYTQTLINSNVDPDSNNAALIASSKGLLRIKRDFNFYKDKPGVGRVLKVTKAKAEDAQLAQATIKIAGALETALKAPTKAVNAPNRVFCRLDIYVGMEGAEPYIYSTPWVQKGMPFWVEFTVNKDDNAKTICENIVKAIKDNHLFLCDKDLLKVSINEGNDTVVLDATSEFQRFRKITVSMFNETQDDAEVQAELYPVVGAEGHEGDVIKLINNGKAGFGTYSHIIKDLRLPTAANYQWSHIRQAETPILGEKYDEYIIEYEAPATNDGLGAVGQKLNSVTTHVFWVREGQAVTDFDAALKTAEINPESESEPYVAPTMEKMVKDAVAAAKVDTGHVGA